MTRTQFIMQMILAYGRLYPGLKADRLMPSAGAAYRDFVKDEKIEFGDERYAWDAFSAQEIVAEREQVALSAVMAPKH